MDSMADSRFACGEVIEYFGDPILLALHQEQQ
jgi:hypothetical protein